MLRAVAAEGGTVAGEAERLARETAGASRRRTDLLLAARARVVRCRFPPVCGDVAPVTHFRVTARTVAGWRGVVAAGL
ncbi:hypothetical protein ABZT11_41350 [Streptomyces avermitilis]